MKTKDHGIKSGFEHVVSEFTSQKLKGTQVSSLEQAMWASCPENQKGRANLTVWCREALNTRKSNWTLELLWLPEGVQSGE